MLPIQVIQIFRQSEEELTPATSRITFTSNSHRQSTDLGVFELWDGFGDKVLVVGVGGRGGWKEVEDGTAAQPRVSGVTRLSDKVFDDIVESTKVVAV